MNTQCYICRSGDLVVEGRSDLCFKHRLLVAWRLLHFLLHKDSAKLNGMKQAYVSDPRSMTAQQTRVMQDLQFLFADNGHTLNLADIRVFVVAMQHRYGETASLEQVIQRLAGLELQAQQIRRRTLKVQQRMADPGSLSEQWQQTEASVHAAIALDVSTLSNEKVMLV